LPCAAVTNLPLIALRTTVTVFFLSFAMLLTSSQARLLVRAPYVPHELTASLDLLVPTGVQVPVLVVAGGPQAQSSPGVGVALRLP
jgi:hypothetical protein